MSKSTSPAIVPCIIFEMIITEQIRGLPSEREYERYFTAKQLIAVCNLLFSTINIIWRDGNGWEEDGKGIIAEKMLLFIDIPWRKDDEALEDILFSHYTAALNADEGIRSVI
ncbi:hypothetical protein LOAG_00631 [Loa loa]|uniref:Uncharacterized protein n=1 Tax=Loa loa TaxID=7209 RepID=A0A1S0UB94_LOALO|nr:hypothetical protein LOAG_00631 [Loa loa]EFO27855.1 hypothetical protein LOAG_00631 [Loa loa]